VSLCSHPPGSRKTRWVNRIELVDCKACNELLRVEDLEGRIRPAKFKKFVKLWRSLPNVGLQIYVWACRAGEEYKTQDDHTPKFCPQHGRAELSFVRKEEVGQVYLNHEVASSIGVDEETVQKYVELVAGADLDGKPFPYPMGSHRAIYRDPDPEEHAMGPDGELVFVAIDGVRGPGEIPSGRDFQISVQVDFLSTCAVPVAVVLNDVTAGGHPLCVLWDNVNGNGSKTFTFSVEGPSNPSTSKLLAQTYFLEGASNTWKLSDTCPIDLAFTEPRNDPIGLVVAVAVEVAAVTAPLWLPRLIDAFSQSLRQ